MEKRLSVGMVLSALVIPGVGHAQTVPNPEKSPPKEQAQGTTAAASKGEPAESADILVTAQRRSERLVDVPISMSVLNGRSLEQLPVQSANDVLARVPGVAVATQAQAGVTLLSIRGVTAPSAFNAGSSPAGYYLDSVPFGFVRQATAPDPNVYDLDRIEVLRGPQGTLYGAGSQSGVVRVLTQDPDLGAVSAKGRAVFSGVDGGSTGIQANAALNVPLVQDKLGLRAVFGYEDLPGWVNKPTRTNANDGTVKNGRIKLKAQPSDDLSIVLAAWFSRATYGSPSISDKNRFNPSPDTEATDQTFDIYSARLEYDLGAAILTSSTSYIKYASDNTLDLRVYGTPINLRTRLSARTFSQEVSLQSAKSGPWRWSVGGIYRNGQDRLFQVVSSLAFPQDVIFTSKSWAVFGEVTRSLFDDRLDLTAGLRHFEDRVTTDERSRGANAVPASFINRSVSFQSTTPRLVATFHVKPRLNVYASYSEGFRSGFDQLPAIIAVAPSFAPVKPDLLKNYELGSKGDLAGGMLSYDLALYYTDWRDVQLPLVVQLAGFGRSAAVNGASARGPGVDASITLRPMSGLTLDGSFNWNDLKVKGNVLSNNIILFRDGDRLNNSPKYTVGVSAAYQTSLGSSGLTGRGAVSYNWTSARKTASLVGANVARLSGDNIGLARADLSISSASRWTLGLFVDNITDENGAVIVEPNAVNLASPYNPRPRPRTFGIRGDIGF